MEDYDFKSSNLDWENFRSLNSYQLSSSSSSSSSPQPKIQLKEWSMAIIRDSLPDDDYSIFPPSNHENLFPPSNPEPKQETPLSAVSLQSNSPSTSSRSYSSCSSSSFSFSDDETSYSPSSIPSNHQVVKSREISRWMFFGVQILRTRITSIASKIWSKTAKKTAFLLFTPAGRIMLGLTFWWLYKRARQRRLRRSTDRLRMIIQEKDEKICQLSRQIVELNGVLLAQQKGLPSK